MLTVIFKESCAVNTLCNTKVNPDGKLSKLFEDCYDIKKPTNLI